MCPDTVTDCPDRGRGQGRAALDLGRFCRDRLAGCAGAESKGQSVIESDSVSAGRRVVVGLASWLAGQDQALENARRASTVVSRRRVERDAVEIYLDQLTPAEEADLSTEEWPGSSARTAD